MYSPLFLSYLARTNAELNQFEGARRCIEGAMTVAETTKERWFEAEIYRTAGQIALMSREKDEAKAETFFKRALAVARAQQAKELRASMSMARLWRDLGKREDARDLLASIYGWFTEGFETLDLKEAKALLEEFHADNQVRKGL
jgi:predicted ATPase